MANTTRSPIRPEQTVQDVAHHHPGALEILKQKGINHCCGGRLSLREAAAAAAVPLAALLAALNEHREPNPQHRTVLDVRGLEPPQPLMQVLEAIDRLDPVAELEVHHDRRPLLLYPQLDERGFVHETSEPEPGLVRILIRRAKA